MLNSLNIEPTVQVGNVKIGLELGEACAKSKQIAIDELRETPENITNGLRTLRRLLDADQNLSYPQDDRFLIRFLRVCKYYPVSASELVKRYYAFKVKHADIYNGLVPSREEKTFHHNVLVVFPQRDQSNRRLVVLQLGKHWNHKEVTLDEFFKAAVLLLEAALLEEETQINGVVVIFDMAGLSLQQTWQFTPGFAKRLVDWLQDAIPLRVKAIHIINQPKIFSMVFALFKPFLREKLRSRILFHGDDRQSLFKHISPDHLSQEYGGNRKDPFIPSYEWYKVISMFEKNYEEANTFGYRK